MPSCVLARPLAVSAGPAVGHPVDAVWTEPPMLWAKDHNLWITYTHVTTTSCGETLGLATEGRKHGVPGAPHFALTPQVSKSMGPPAFRMARFRICTVSFVACLAPGWALKTAALPAATMEMALHMTVLVGLVLGVKEPITP